MSALYIKTMVEWIPFFVLAHAIMVVILTKSFPVII